MQMRIKPAEGLGGKEPTTLIPSSSDEAHHPAPLRSSQSSSLPPLTESPSQSPTPPNKLWPSSAVTAPAQDASWLPPPISPIADAPTQETCVGVHVFQKGHPSLTWVS